MSRAHIERMAREGTLYLWYYIYRPVGAVPNVENALTKEQIRDFRRFIVEQRRDAPCLLSILIGMIREKPMSGGDGYEPSYISVGGGRVLPAFTDG